jgi:hypothetical protein
MAKVIVQHSVADYDTWFAVFTEHGAVRRGHGATGHSVTRSAADPNSIVIVNEFATLEGATAFSQDPSRLGDGLAGKRARCRCGLPARSTTRVPRD